MLLVKEVLKQPRSKTMRTKYGEAKETYLQTGRTDLLSQVVTDGRYEAAKSAHYLAMVHLSKGLRRYDPNKKPSIFKEKPIDQLAFNEGMKWLFKACNLKNEESILILATLYQHYKESGYRYGPSFVLRADGISLGTFCFKYSKYKFNPENRACWNLITSESQLLHSISDNKEAAKRLAGFAFDYFKVLGAYLNGDKSYLGVWDVPKLTRLFISEKDLEFQKEAQQFFKRPDGEDFDSGDEEPAEFIPFVEKQVQTQRTFNALYVMWLHNSYKAANELEATKSMKMLLELCAENCSIALNWLENAIRLGCEGLNYSTLEQCENLRSTLVERIAMRARGESIYDEAKIIYFRENDFQICCNLLENAINKYDADSARLSYFRALIELNKAPTLNLSRAYYFNHAIPWLIQASYFKHEQACLLAATIYELYEQKQDAEIVLNLDGHHLGNFDYRYSKCRGYFQYREPFNCIASGSQFLQPIAHNQEAAKKLANYAAYYFKILKDHLETDSTVNNPLSYSEKQGLKRLFISEKDLEFHRLLEIQLNYDGINYSNTKLSRHWDYVEQFAKQKIPIFGAVLRIYDYYSSEKPDATKAARYENLIWDLCLDACPLAIEWLKNAIKLDCKDLEFSTLEQCEVLNNNFLKLREMRKNKADDKEVKIVQNNVDDDSIEATDSAEVSSFSWSP